MTINQLLCFNCMEKLQQPGQICPHCGHDNRYRINDVGMLTERVLNGQYQVGRVLGRGGFGVTYIGYDLNLERKVAIKEYFPPMLVSRDMDSTTLVAMTDRQQEYQRGMQRALAEGKMAASFGQVPGVVQIYNVFCANNTVYLIMEYVAGQTLTGYVEQQVQRLTPEQVVWLLEPVVSALEELHSQNVVHRDVKPDNIMVRAKDRRGVLLDFGAARLLDNKTLSASAAVVSSGYAPAEQYDLSSLDGRMDQYALAATLLFTLTGLRPPDVMQRISVPGSLPNIRSNNPSVSPAAERAILKGMAMRPEDRFPDVGAFWNAFTGKTHGVSRAARGPAASRPGSSAKALKIVGAAVVSVAVTGLLLAGPALLKDSEELPAGPAETVMATAEPEATILLAQAQTDAPTAVPLSGHTAVPVPTATPTPKPTATPKPAAVQPDLTAVRQVTAGEWVLDILKDGTAAIGRYTGSDTAVVIPGSIDGYKVTAIGEKAFAQQTRLRSITLPESLAMIGDSAFDNCQRLTRLEIPAGVQYVGKRAFLNCSQMALSVAPGNRWLEMQGGVLFSTEDKRLIFVSSAAAGDTYTVPAGTKIIENGAFYYNHSIRKVILPEGLTHIRDYAFFGCNHLASADLPGSLVSLGAHAFLMCDELAALRLPAGLKEIGDGAFSLCPALTLTLDPANPDFEMVGDYLMGVKDKRLIYCPFGIKTCQVPEGTKILGGSLFHTNRKLTDITIPDSVTTIGGYAFYECNKLSGIKLPDSVATIGDSAFYNCDSIKVLTLPDKVSAIGEYAFYECDWFTLKVAEGSYAHRYAEENRVPFKKK